MLNFEYVIHDGHPFDSLVMQQVFNQSGIRRNYTPGAVLDLDPEYVYRLERGIMKMVETHEDGRQRIKYIFMPGDIFGTITYLLNGKHNYHERVIALQYVQLSALPLRQVREMMRTDPAFEERMLETIGKRIIKLEHRLDAMVFLNTEQRVHSFLKEFFLSYGQYDCDKRMIPNLLTHEEISTLTGTSRQNVTRVFNKLRKDGFIEYDKEKIVMLRDLPG